MKNYYVIFPKFKEKNGLFVYQKKENLHEFPKSIAASTISDDSLTMPIKAKIQVFLESTDLYVSINKL